MFLIFCLALHGNAARDPEIPHHPLSLNSPTLTLNGTLAALRRTSGNYNSAVLTV